MLEVNDIVYDTEEEKKLEELGFVSEYVDIRRHAGKTYISPAFKAADLEGRFCSKGTKVRYLDRNGYDCHREYAASKGIVFDQILTVKTAYIGQSSSDYEFEEVEGKFNTVMFEDASIQDNYIRDLTESGDYYKGSKEAWIRYRNAWRVNDMALVYKMEEGAFNDFHYDPEEPEDEYEEG